MSPVNLAARLDAWRALEAARVDGLRREAGFHVRFRGEPSVCESLRTLVAAERDCCGWARWEVVEEDGWAVLKVTGPPGRIDALASAFGL